MMHQTNPAAPQPQKTTRFELLFRAVDVILLALILVGAIFRLSWVNWSQGANLHPDEYGLTSTLTALQIPKNLDGYFNTRISPISPYNKYDEQGNFLANGPDNRMRWGQWPIILLRWMGEATGNTGYDQIRLMGRTISACLDLLSIGLLYLIGRRLYGHRVGLLAAALSSLAVMQIQQSHFMTADNFAVFFTVLSLYSAVRIAQQPVLVRWAVPGRQRSYTLRRNGWVWYAAFGAAFGMAMASRINLLPLAGMVIVAAFISVADLKLGTRQDLQKIILTTLMLMVIAGSVSLVTFRLTSPMTFRAATGNTSLLTLHFNQDWLDSMQVASMESKGIGGGPPSEQWASRPAIIFPLVNMVMWGMGLPLGLAAWAAFGWIGWQIFRWGRRWQAHLLPWVWVGGYFLFMGTRWVKSVRYFLPIYPFLALLAAWGLVEIFRVANGKRKIIPGLLLVLVIGGTFAYANAFTAAVYRQDHTRVQAVKWIYQTIPAPFHLGLSGEQGSFAQPVGAPDGLQIQSGQPYSVPFRVERAGLLKQVLVPHVVGLEGAAELRIAISVDPAGSNLLDEARLTIQPISQGFPGDKAAGQFQGTLLQVDQIYYLVAWVEQGTVRVSRSVIANESWDEGLPFPFLGYDPFGQFYSGLTNEVRWYDDENKKRMFLEVLAQADYLILPSQRAIWSAPRIPPTYPMTLEYYRALFDGRLGFELAAHFQSPFVLGPLQVSDVGGTFAWNAEPRLPLFNNNLLAAEEAFSVYDHPPVWIFKKTADFDIEKVRAILDSVDLSTVVVQGPRSVTAPPVTE